MNFGKMVRGMARLKDISENVLGDQLNTERYVKELTDVVREMFMASGPMFQQEHLRFITALQARDASRAAELLNTHILSARDRVLTAPLEQVRAEWTPPLAPASPASDQPTKTTQKRPRLAQ